MKRPRGLGCLIKSSGHVVLFGSESKRIHKQMQQVLQLQYQGICVQ